MAYLLIRFRNDQSGTTAIEYGLPYSLVGFGGMSAAGVSIRDCIDALFINSTRVARGGELRRIAE